MLVVTLLPFFGAGVLAMLMLARHWFGPEPRFPDKVALTGLLLAAGGTLLGIAALAVSAVYDYHLQVPHIGGMQGMAPCTGSCVPREQHEIFVLHVRGVWMVGRWLLLSNAVLVTWLVAMWGGRIKLTTSCADEVAALQVAPARAGGLRRDVRLLLVGALVGAAIIHAAVMPEHFAEWLAAGVFFVALTVAELAVAGLLLTASPRTPRPARCCRRLGHPADRLAVVASSGPAVRTRARCHRSDRCPRRARLCPRGRGAAGRAGPAAAGPARSAPALDARPQPGGRWS